MPALNELMDQVSGNRGSANITLLSNPFLDHSYIFLMDRQLLPGLNLIPVYYQSSTICLKEKDSGRKTGIKTEAA